MKFLKDEEFFAIRKDFPEVGRCWRGTVEHIAEPDMDESLCGRNLVSRAMPTRVPDEPFCERCIALAKERMT